eukprot:CAMPEP_0118680758 /NCGR_PEP_ID=MMETSP0800-20121206/4551_1 /TAXON_ID=210618 ORGANISM="Striatella unipunctata, Strain CCMP2910" /NCGR_SAMPLE_ID=MMETSP0800 /ASSEMBLY_ACC=CAM_ASM_000638 /LENGTH=119 /DNA_ID=CAMNT_0006576959 /DNA_START=138 /DNA_END=497 /DNA_ORIENTATION=+
MLEQRPLEALTEAKQAGMDVIIKEGMANGRVLRHPNIKQWALEFESEPDQLALASILAQPFDARVLSGGITEDQLESNFNAFETLDNIMKNPDLLGDIMKESRVKSEDYWAERSALAWN